ncbi:MAG: outer membrane beta-barrel protein [Proteobacteria bacterium]|jgi:opacity protein-like surface antigen|nr:outer membrane beta-barrel protein [Pseudomonadota bacterium]
MHHLTKPALTSYLVLSLFCLGMLTGTAVAADDSPSFSSPSNRTDKWEFSLIAQYISSASISFNDDTSADLNDTIGWGFGVGYNFNEKMALNFNVNWSNISYNANYFDENGASKTGGGNLYGSNANLAFTYNFMPKRFTPFVTGVIGWQYIDTDIANGPPQNACWYYPYYGYICNGYQPTYSADNYTYGWLGGVRFDVGQAMFIKASVGQQYLNTDNAGTPAVGLGRLEFGWMFK